MSTKIDVTAQVPIYEKNGEEVKTLELPKVVVESHWNYGDRVVLRVDGGKNVTVVGQDLIEAVRRCIR